MAPYTYIWIPYSDKIPTLEDFQSFVDRLKNNETQLPLLLKKMVM